MKVDFHKDLNPGHSELFMGNFEKETSSPAIWGLLCPLSELPRENASRISKQLFLSQHTYLSFQENYQHIFISQRNSGLNEMF